MGIKYKIVTFYKFKSIGEIAPIVDLRYHIKSILEKIGIKGTIILAEEGFNSTIAGTPDQIDDSLRFLADVFKTEINARVMFSNSIPFRRLKVRLKPEIVTFKRNVDIRNGLGTHVAPEDWDDLIKQENTLILDARNEYEFRTGTFSGAINPSTTKFSELPDYVLENLDPQRHKRIAVFCTGGIRCEKFAPWLVEQGFAEVFQLEGGILAYLDAVSGMRPSWQGECFVFDERVTLDKDLSKGKSLDLSQREAAE